MTLCLHSWPQSASPEGAKSHWGATFFCPQILMYPFLCHFSRIWDLFLLNRNPYFSNFSNKNATSFETEIFLSFSGNIKFGRLQNCNPQGERLLNGSVAVQPSGTSQIQIRAIMDRSHNVKSVTVPQPTRVCLTPGALLTYRKPGRSICFCIYIISQ